MRAHGHIMIVLVYFWLALVAMAAVLGRSGYIHAFHIIGILALITWFIYNQLRVSRV